MAFQVEAHLINPAILRALTRAARPLSAAEASALRSEISQDPQNVGYRLPAPESVDGEPQPPPSLKGAHEVARLLNESGRTQELFGALLLEAADVMQAAA